MTRTLAALATAAVLGTASMAAPAQAHGWHHGWGGPGLAFGLAAGALTAGAIAATSPYYYEPDYYYAPGPVYYAPGPYAYYGGPYYYRHHYWRHW